MTQTIELLMLAGDSREDSVTYPLNIGRSVSLSYIVIAKVRDGKLQVALGAGATCGAHEGMQRAKVESDTSNITNRKQKTVYEVYYVLQTIQDEKKTGEQDSNPTAYFYSMRLREPIR